MFQLCLCKKCGAHLEPDVEETIDLYQEEFNEKRIVYMSEEPPVIFDYLILRCSNPECNTVTKMLHEEILREVRTRLSKFAWAYHLRDENNKFRFQEHFTKYIMLKGLSKFVSQEDLDNNKILEDYVRYVEGQLTEDSED